MRTLTRQRAEALLVLDQQVGRLVRTLKETGEYDAPSSCSPPTTATSSASTGCARARSRPTSRRCGCRSWSPAPGVPHGQRFDPITTEDVSATLLDLGRAEPPHPLDGRSVVPSFERDRGWQVPVLTEGLETSAVFRDAATHPVPGFTDARTTIGIRTPRWKYVRYVDGDGELYDLDATPTSCTTGSASPRYAAVQAELEQVWTAHKDCRGAACSAPLPADLAQDPDRLRATTEAQSRQVEARYGYSR